VSGFVKNETAALQGSGTFIGQATTDTDTTSHNDGGDVIKFENTAKVFINGDVAENAALHAELNFVYDTEATPNDYQGHMNYSQQDYLREFYVDSLFGENDDIEVRLGKQQVVWGTADGMKLLDIINPTDYREFAQNTMEDSRIPIWMLKVDAPAGETGSLQGIIFQSESNKIAGFSTIGSGSVRSTTATRDPATGMATAMVHNTSGVDSGNPYIMKGVDSISGSVYGILNIVPELSEVAKTFGDLSAGFAYNGGGAPAPSYHLNNWYNANVYDFVYNSGNGAAFGGACPNVGIGSDSTQASSAYCLQQIAANTNEGKTALLNGMDSSVTGAGLTQGAGGSTAGTWDSSNPDTVFEYMEDASFKTFATFANASTKYLREEPNSTDPNFGLRFKDSLDSGLNYSVNYTYQYDPNPYIEMEWQNSSGEKLTPVETQDNAANYGDYTGGTGYTNITLRDSSGSTAYGYVGSTTTAAYTVNPVTLVLKEKRNRIHNIGGSFDTTVDSESLGGVVLRGEFLYQKDVMTPVVDKAKMSVGNITEAFTFNKGDKFKYVLGADVTVLTNLLVSGQFIQERNLDYVDTTTTIGSGTGSVTKARYTADLATMHLTNGYQKAEENKEFYSLFLSKPFGPSQLGRWNNIFIYEEGGGKWNRFDVEYSFSDELVGSFELNNYWGDANTQFGQMEDSSNIQVGLKYIF